MDLVVFSVSNAIEWIRDPLGDRGVLVCKHSVRYNASSVIVGKFDVHSRHYDARYHSLDSDDHHGNCAYSVHPNYSYSVPSLVVESDGQNDHHQNHLIPAHFD